MIVARARNGKKYTAGNHIFVNGRITVHGAGKIVLNLYLNIIRVWGAGRGSGAKRRDISTGKRAFEPYKCTYERYRYVLHET